MANLTGLISKAGNMGFNIGKYAEMALGSALNYVGGNLSSKKAYHYQSNLLNRQQAFARETMQNAHQWEMQDLDNAGLNPQLTATGGNGATASGVTTAPSVNAPHYGDAATLISSASQADLNKALKMQANAMVNKTNYEAENIEADTEIKRLDKEYKMVQNKWAPSWFKEKVLNLMEQRFLYKMQASAAQAKADLDRRTRPNKWRIGPVEGMEGFSQENNPLDDRYWETVTEKDSKGRPIKVRVRKSRDY